MLIAFDVRRNFLKHILYTYGNYLKDEIEKKLW